MALRVHVCSMREISEGALRAFRVKGVTWPVIVTVIDGEIIACAGVCPHEDVALWGGDLTGSTLTCPGHGYMFDLHTGRCAHDANLELRRYPVTLVDDEVWVDLL